MHCHLVPEWLPELEGFIHSYLHKKVDTVNPRFRLWMVSCVSETFPSYIVANSVCLAISKVHSMRQTMMDTFKELTPSNFDLDMMYSVAAGVGDSPLLQECFPVGDDLKFDEALRSAYKEPASSKRRQFFRKCFMLYLLFMELWSNVHPTVC